MPAMASAALTAGNTGLSAAAAGSGLSTDCSGSACLAQIVGKLINVVLGFLGIVLLAIVMYAGFTWMTAGGSQERVTSAKNILKNSFIGILLIFFSYTIISIFFSFLNG